ncbi:kelch domain-containing protein [Plasmodium cynomolgi strain B]|uniref:Kelch domain-containing protein n=1 Tax=Plasmodium cynomolgi (strain B) TaxID=1120755 RepID=K6V8F6_PLACD|nr:kelch domain-containing protein [Plasmodium cynomolgi strain B]GAB65437.1 kelch domain-containing protein [Plasmodium cynomolgi strain B]
MGKKNKKSKEKQEKIKLKKEKQKLKSLKTKKKNDNSGNHDVLSDADFETICLYYENLNKKDKYGHINVNTTSNNTFVECEKPSPRSNCSVTFINEEEFLLFGGEYNNNHELVAYNDLFKYNVVKDKWKYYFTTAVYFNKKLYIFGGELCTNTQFFHYNDFWSFDIKNNTFEEIECKNKRDEKPSPRSGHRMILWKSSIIMFGGFFDNGKSVEYFSDLYMYVISSNKWVNLTSIYVDCLFRRLTQEDGANTGNSLSTTKNEKKKKGDKTISQNVKNAFFKNFDLDSYMPSKRSSVSLFTDMKFQRVYIYGGYAQIKNTSRNAIGAYYNDLWVVNISYTGEDNIQVNFKKLKKSIFQPSKRIGFSTCIYKNSLILFGGVFDKVENNNTNKATTQTQSSTSTGLNNTTGKVSSLEESLNIQSIFFNDLYSFDMNKEHWSYLSLKGNSDVREINRNGKENKKKRNGELNPDSPSGGSSSKQLLPGDQDPLSKSTEGRFGASKDSASDGYDSSRFTDGDNNDDEYYSNLFVYFDENGNKKTIKIDQENEESRSGNESHNEKKEFHEKSPNGNSHAPNVNKEKGTWTNQVIDSHSVFMQCEQSAHAGLANVVGDSKRGKKGFEKCCIPNGDHDDHHNGGHPPEGRDAPGECAGQEDHSAVHDLSATNDPSAAHDPSAVHDLTDSDSDSDTNEADKKTKFVINGVEPIGRINSHIFVTNKTLHLLGGMYEYKNNEIMLSDHWKINIFKREKWELVHKGNLDDIYVEETDSSSSLSIDDEDKDEKEIENLIISDKIKKMENKIKAQSGGFIFDANENLNEFFLRTKEHWLKELNVDEENKRSRKDAFVLCEQKYQVLKKYHRKIHKYRELLLAEECGSSMTEGSSSDLGEESSS